jgi:hypothetical protein
VRGVQVTKKKKKKKTKIRKIFLFFFKKNAMFFHYYIPYKSPKIIVHTYNEPFDIYITNLLHCQLPTQTNFRKLFHPLWKCGGIYIIQYGYNIPGKVHGLLLKKLWKKKNKKFQGGIHLQFERKIYSSNVGISDVKSCVTW